MKIVHKVGIKSEIAVLQQRKRCCGLIVEPITVPSAHESIANEDSLLKHHGHTEQ